MPDDWKARILHARQMAELRRAPLAARTEMGQAFRRLVIMSIEPAFLEVARFAAEQGAECRVELALNGVQPRAMFYVRPSGRSIRYEMDADGNAVREIEGVYYRALGQRMVWSSIESLNRTLTGGYARTAAAALVQEHFRSLSA
jgi:hypothetical protein